MANRRMEFFIGMTVLAVLVGVIVMTITFGPSQGLFTRGKGKTMVIEFESAGGIGPNSLIKKNGIQIGRVNQIELLDSPDQSRVRVEFNLNPQFEIYTNEVARITRSLLGDASIEFVKNQDYHGTIEPRLTTEVITGVRGGDLAETVNNIEGNLSDAIDSVTNTANGMKVFLDKLNSFLGNEEELAVKKERVQKIATNLGTTLENFGNLANNVNSVLNQPQVLDNLRGTIDNGFTISETVKRFVTQDRMALIGDTLNKTNELMINANELTQKGEQLTGDLQQTMLNINDFTNSLAEHGPEFFTAVSESSTQIQKSIQNIGVVTQAMAEGVEDRSTLLGMLNDRDVATSVRGIVNNTEAATEKIHPILDDARVFSNKIAHKPSELLWGKTSYKGNPSSSTYGFQSNSPGGGLSSSLYRPTSASRMWTSPLQYQPSADTSVMTPETYAYYASHYPQIAQEKPSFFSTLKTKLCPWTSDSASMRSDSAAVPMNENDAMMLNGDFNEGFDGSFSNGFNGVAPSSYETSYASRRLSDNSGKMRFSLGSALRNSRLTQRNSNAEMEQAPMFSDGYANDGYINVQAYPAAYSADNFESLPSSVSYEETLANGSMNAAAYGNSWELGASTNAHDGYPEGVNANSSINGLPYGSDSGMQEIPLEPITRSSRSGATKMNQNTLPNALPQSMSTSASNEEALPVSINRLSSSPKAVPPAPFVDDGLPVQYVPPTQ